MAKVQEREQEIASSGMCLLQPADFISIVLYWVLSVSFFLVRILYIQSAFVLHLFWIQRGFSEGSVRVQ